MKLRKAVLIIHGFAGGPYDQETLARYLQLDFRFDVYTFTLPGHDSRANKAGYEDWINKSEQMVEYLIDNGYNKIYVIGHSMGGVIAAYLATKYANIKKLVLAAPAFRYLLYPEDKVNVMESIKKSTEVVKQYGIGEVISRMFKLPTSAVKEFMTLVKEKENTPSLISIPTLILQGKNDNLVPPETAKEIFDKIKTSNKELIYFKGVSHDIFRDKNVDTINKIVRNYLKFSKKKKNRITIIQ